MLSPGLGRTKTGRLWAHVRDDRPFCGKGPLATVYFYSPDRGGEHPARHDAPNGDCIASGFVLRLGRQGHHEAVGEVGAGRAFHYTLKRRDALSRCLTDALCAGSNAGGERAASTYTIMQTAKLNNINPEAYLRDALTRIAEGHPINRIDELMPWQRVPLA